MSLLLAGKIKTLIDRLTSTRAGNLDNIDSTTMAHIDVDISSRAAASTALSTATWTNTKAGYLNASIAAIPTTNIRNVRTGFVNSERLTATATIYGETLGYYDVTIAALTNTDKCLVQVAGSWDPDGMADDSFDTGNKFVTAELTSTTNLRFIVPDNSSAGRITAFYRITEFY